MIFESREQLAGCSESWLDSQEATSKRVSVVLNGYNWQQVRTPSIISCLSSFTDHF